MIDFYRKVGDFKVSRHRVTLKDIGEHELAFEIKDYIDAVIKMAESGFSSVPQYAIAMRNISSSSVFKGSDERLEEGHSRAEVIKTHIKVAKDYLRGQNTSLELLFEILKGSSLNDKEKKLVMCEIVRKTCSKRPEKEIVEKPIIEENTDNLAPTETVTEDLEDIEVIPEELLKEARRFYEEHCNILNNE